MKANEQITFEYCARVFNGSLSSSKSKIDDKPLIFFRDFDGSQAWISQSQVKIIKVGF